MSRAAYFRKWHARNPQYRHDWQLRAAVTQGKWAFIFGIRVRVNLLARASLLWIEAPTNLYGQSLRRQ